MNPTPERLQVVGCPFKNIFGKPGTGPLFKSGQYSSC